MPRRRVVLLVLALVGATLAGVSPSARAATTFFVDILDGGCSDVSGPVYCSIQAAVNDASDGYTIQIAAGTYTSSSTYVVNINNLDLTFDGAGEGVTIIDGQNLRGGIEVLFSEVTIQDLTITQASRGVSGGGIQLATPGDHVITDVTISDSHSGSSGGGIYLDPSGSATLTRVTLSGNDAPYGAGMDAIGSGTITITDGEFTDNDATGYGGAIFVQSSGLDVTIITSTFTDNDAGQDGGAIFFDGNADSTLSIADSTFHSNETASDSSNGGGAIYFADSPSLTVSGSTFTQNYSGKMGGAIYDLGDQVATITNSTFVGNSADDHGGAIFSGGDLNNLTVVGNTATIGGGIADNSTEALEVGNSIIYNNTASTGNDCGNTMTSLGYNLFGTVAGCTIGGATGNDIVGQNPQLGSLGPNGGPTETMAFPASSSPAYNAANPTAPGSGSPACAADDQRGVEREDSRCDIGAFEAPAVIRYAGVNRYATAMVVSQNEHPTGAPHAFVATGFNFPDALAGAAVAGRLGAPLLLVDSGIPASTGGELFRLEPFLITILGGTGAVSGSTETALGGYADTVERVASTNRYLTAVEISKKAFSTDGSADVVYVATGLGFADALAAGPAAAALNGPVLLVDGVSLLQAVADEIVRLTPDRIIVVGGSSVISDGVLAALDALQGGDTVERISGPNRYATAVAISEDAFPDGAPRVYIATGLNFPDALAGAAAAGMHGSPVLLVPGSSLPAVVSAEITRLGANTIYILGGTAVVSSGVEDDLKTLIGAS